ncbi:hypothetical protein DFH09DRAFT_1369650 [Mycena vulgaris]|nr:hypothetical protein DFH09DRAFT_1369650 [Mycena vulgaris]
MQTYLRALNRAHHCTCERRRRSTPRLALAASSLAALPEHQPDVATSAPINAPSLRSQAPPSVPAVPSRRLPPPAAAPPSHVPRRLRPRHLPRRHLPNINPTWTYLRAHQRAITALASAAVGARPRTWKSQPPLLVARAASAAPTASSLAASPEHQPNVDLPPHPSRRHHCARKRRRRCPPSLPVASLRSTLPVAPGCALCRLQALGPPRWLSTGSHLT